jgi:hypothetical protein
MPRGLSEPAHETLHNGAVATGMTLDVFTAVFQAERFEGSVLIGAHVRGSDLTLTPDERIELSYVAVDRWGKVRAAERRAFTLTLRDETQARIQETGLRLFGRLRLPRGRYEIRVAAHQPGGATGSWAAEVEVPDFANFPLSVSDLVVTSSEARRLTTLEEDAVLRGVLPAQPTPTRRFGRTETMTVFGEVYDSHWILSREIGVTIGVTAEDGRPVFRQEQTLDSGNHGRFYATGAVRLDQLAPGAYVLTLEAHTRSGIPATASQQLRFEVSDERAGS